MKKINLAMKVSAVSIACNLGLSVFKLAAGLIAHSDAMVSDAVHSASDVLSTFAVMIGVSISERKADAEHPYGHERMECVASIVLAVMLAATGLGIGYAGVKKIMGGADTLTVPGGLALAAAVISIVVKEAMYWYTRSAAKKLNSGALMADAWHHRSDALSSVGSFIGILGARLGFPVLDPAAGIVICVFIEKAAIDIFKDACDKMVDKSAPEDLTHDINRVICEQEGVVRVDDVKTRMFGAKLYADVEIAVDGHMMLEDAHAIAENVHHAVEQNFPDVKHCMVHVNPAEEESGNGREEGKN
ncbi:MAG: cation diffusion facilitator family transporter [Lachnospiraceae bacterium]|nr:cation diffusion facilitator family transporter [Lachnospiraceae bacterium]